MTKPTYIDDYAAITEVLNKYNEGGKQAKSEIMKPAFAEEAWGQAAPRHRDGHLSDRKLRR